MSSSANDFLLPSHVSTSIAAKLMAWPQGTFNSRRVQGHWPHSSERRIALSDIATQRGREITLEEWAFCEKSEASARQHYRILKAARRLKPAVVDHKQHELEV